MFVTNSWQPDNRIKNLFPWAMLFLLLLVSFALRWRYVWIPSFNYDEGHWLMFALLANAGYPAYSATFVGIPPLALLLIQLGARLAETSLAVRYPMMLVSLVGVGSIFWSFRPKRDRFGLMAGTLAATFLSFAPIYFQESVSIMAEVPAVAMALLSLVLAQQFYYNGKLRWLLLSGVVFGCSLALKIFVIFLPILVGFLILLAVVVPNKPSLKTGGQLIISALVWSAGVVLLLIPLLMIYDAPTMYEQVIQFRFALRDVTLARGITPLTNMRGLAQAVVDYSPQLIGALLGIIVGWRKRRFDIFVWTIWFILAVLLLIWHVPLRGRYFVLLLPALAALDSIVIAWLVLWFTNRDKTGQKWLGRIGGALLLTIVAGWAMVVPVKSVLASPHPDSSTALFGFSAETVRDAIEFVKKNTTPDDCVVTDDQRLAIAAGRLVPPGLSETSSARLRTGWLINSDTILEEANRYNCPIFVYMSEIRFNKFMPQLSAQLRQLYLLEITYDETRTIYAFRKNVTHQPETPFIVKFGDNINLLGIDVTPAPWYPGQQIQLATYWTALAPPPEAYKISLRLKNDQGETIANFDHFPFPAPSSKYRLILTTSDLYQIRPNVDNLENISEEDLAIYPAKGMVPTNGWPAGQTIRETTTIALPADLAPGPYHLHIGLYDPDTLNQLPIQTESGPASEFLLATVEIVAPN